MAFQTEFSRLAINNSIVPSLSLLSVAASVRLSPFRYPSIEAPFIVVQPTANSASLPLSTTVRHKESSVERLHSPFYPLLSTIQQHVHNSAARPQFSGASTVQRRVHHSAVFRRPQPDAPGIRHCSLAGRREAGNAAGLRGRRDRPCLPSDSARHRLTACRNTDRSRALGSGQTGLAVPILGQRSGTHLNSAAGQTDNSWSASVPARRTRQACDLCGAAAC